MATIVDAFPTLSPAIGTPDVLPSTISSLTLEELQSNLQSFRDALTLKEGETEEDPQFNSDTFPEHRLALLALITYMHVDFSPVVNRLDILSDSTTSRMANSTRVINPRSENRPNVMERFRQEMIERNYAGPPAAVATRSAAAPKITKYRMDRQEALAKLDDFLGLIRSLLEIERYDCIVSNALALKIKIQEDLRRCTLEHNRSKELMAKLEGLRKSMESVSALRNELATTQESEEQRGMLDGLYTTVGTLSRAVQESIPMQVLENKIAALTKLETIIMSPLRRFTRIVTRLYCPVCLELIPASKFKYNMGCGHTFCSDCAERMESCAICRCSKTLRTLYVQENIGDAPAPDNVEPNVQANTDLLVMDVDIPTGIVLPAMGRMNRDQ
jgi:hypothetical protein